MASWICASQTPRGDINSIFISLSYVLMLPLWWYAYSGKKGLWLRRRGKGECLLNHLCSWPLNNSDSLKQHSFWQDPASQSLWASWNFSLYLQPQLWHQATSPARVSVQRNFHSPFFSPRLLNGCSFPSSCRLGFAVYLSRRRLPPREAAIGNYGLR